ncbi:hypothetical protein Zmor_010274 [Zophobas morio]|uniref:TOG domain-containing protein n=2 Tax=Zophobas morio TaxID=2755281 RepID=A0AA38IN65_9CUCU|nr:hypothetical protein Zmor_010274 [Zophobas morio]
MFVTGLVAITKQNVTVSHSSRYHHVSDLVLKKLANSGEMIDYKSTSGSDSLVERVPSANLDGPISLTWLWEIIVRTKRLPDDLDPKVLFFVLRDRLRNLEREVRQHALRVLADLIPVIDRTHLDKHMEFLLPDLIVNLSHVAPSVRKGTVDVLRIYLKNSPHPNEVLKKLMTVVPQDSHLMQGLLMAVPYFSNYQIGEDTLVFLMRQLFLGVNQEFLRETSICSLVKTRSKLGIERFNNLIGSEKVQEFQELCKEHRIHLPTETKDDNVILETEITLETGPAITMKIHEESENTSYAENSFSSERQDHDDSETELVTRSPRKVHFGGEVVKMRTPESDSNQNSSDDNDVQTSVIIDRPTSIKITVSDNIAAIKTRHKSMIPVRITTGGSNPPTPRKKLRPKRLHKSAPDLGKLQSSKIPLRHDSKSPPKLPQPAPNQEQQVNSLLQSENENPGGRVRKLSRGEDEFSPVPVHNEIEVFHNLTRSPERKVEDDKEDTNMEAEEEPEQNTYPSFQVYMGEEKEEKTSNLSPLEIVVRDLSHKEDTWSRTRALDDLITILRKNSINFDSVSLPQLLQVLFLFEKQARLQYRAQEALALIISTISPHFINELYSQLCSDVVKVLPPPGVRLSLLLMKRSSPKKFFESVTVTPNEREAVLQALIAAARTFPSSEIDLNRGIQIAFDAMKDNKRGVRQAALEALASLAQVAGNTMILQAVNEMSKNDDESNQLVTVIRTRLSRRQLPTVDLDGSVRYSSPREQEEFDWLCGGVPSLHKTTSLNSIKVPSNNYWRHNLRHEIDLPVIRSPSVYDDSNNGSREQIWAVDASSFPKIENGAIEKATLCPVYVLHRDASQVNGKTYRNYDRGRSNSPPRRRTENQETFTDINGNKAKRFFRQAEQFRKSFSSEHIYNGNVKNYEPTSFSLSSRSSTTSTGSSARSGIWLREFRSGIPIPITSDTKLKFRSHRQSSEAFSGPLIAQEPIR